MHKIAKKPKRSDRTKAAILAAARAEFAAAGYEGATIRAIAAAADIDPAMVMRYFGSKEQLFAVAAELDLQLPDLGSLARAHTGAAVVAHFLERWEGDDTLVALLRAAATNDTVAERLRAMFATQLAPWIARLCGGPRSEAITRAGLIATQMLGLALCRYVLKLPPVVALDREPIVKSVGRTIQTYLYGTLS